MASGDTLIVFLAAHADPAATATFDSRNAHPLLDFDGASNEFAVFSGVLPRHYAGGGLSITLHYSMTSATGGDIDWDAQLERIGTGQHDIDSDGFAAALSVDNTPVPAVSGHVDTVTLTFSSGAPMDNLAAGELFRLKITRDALNDTASGDAELHAVEIHET